jgi:hypothetical protein
MVHIIKESRLVPRSEVSLENVFSKLVSQSGTHKKKFFFSGVETQTSS